MKKFLQQCQLALQLIDLTSLNDKDTSETIVTLCQQAHTPYGDTAAICVYPHFIPLADKTLTTLRSASTISRIRLATVSNFPHGGDDSDLALTETRAAITYGAHEVDVVFPWRALLAGNSDAGFTLVQRCKTACAEAGVLLKVILETGELQQDALIRTASEIAIRAGADFLKTSTGKVSVNATPQSARIMLQAIHDMGAAEYVGFKAAGGVRSAEQAIVYLNIAEEIFGAPWLTPRHFRFGASGLLDNLLATLADGCT